MDSQKIQNWAHLANDPVYWLEKIAQFLTDEFRKYVVTSCKLN